jgi:sterol desaturase/sphingolipid hydroxylase (fatty acid hydroxylase superfamily)
MKNTLRTFVAHGLYPILLAATLAFSSAAISRGWDLRRAMFLYLPALLALLITVERRFPLDPAWGMTARSFGRDLRYLVLDGTVIAGTRALAGWIALEMAAWHPGPLSRTPVWLAVPAALLAWDFFQYHLHRYSHEGEGPVGRFLNRTHLAHHLPERVYVVMHGVFHPLNAFCNAVLLQGVIVGLGLSPQAAFAAMLLIDLQTLVSHFNADMRAGWLNYLLIGTELHRFHHSSDPADGGNYGSVLSLWDLVFGTFRYAPGRNPAALGARPEPGMPRPEDLAKVLAYPFRARAEAPAE